MLIPNGFIITRNNFPDNLPRNVQLISYKLVDHILYRSASPTTRHLNQINQFRFDATKTQNFPAVALNKNVEKIYLELWDNSNKKWVKIDMENSENFHDLNNYLDWGGLAFSIQILNQEEKAKITKIFVLGNE